MKTNQINHNSSERLIILDLAKLIAMILMVQGHTIYALGDPYSIDITQTPWNVWHFIRGFTAPAFLFISGIVHVFANKRDDGGNLPVSIIKKRVVAAFLIISIGYLLNFPASSIFDLFSIDIKYWYDFFKVNILQLIGLNLFISLTLFIVIKKDKTLFIVVSLLALGIIFLSPIIAYSMDIPLPLAFANYFTYANGSLFTMFPFTAYFLFGIAFGIILKKQEERLSFILKYGAITGLTFILISFFFAESYSSIWSMITSFSKSNPGLSFLRIGVVLLALSASVLLYNKSKSLSKYYVLLGKRALFIYVIHLMIIYGSPVFLGLTSMGKKFMNAQEVVFTALGVVLTSILLTLLIDYLLRLGPKYKLAMKLSLTAYLVFAFVV